MMQDGPHYMMWIPVLILLLLAVTATIFFLRPSRPSSVRIEDLARLVPPGAIVPSSNGAPPAAPDIKKHDTIFVLPDISHYTRFMTGNEFAFAHAQYIIFSLINAMIESASGKLELSKLEGDAALFFVDADKHSPEVLGDAVMAIFRAFFTEQDRLKRSNLCPCQACKSIEDLDLKIFVHRGQAARFEFKGAIDHFGTDVIILHRMMKNNASGSRYIMVTQAAQDAVVLPPLEAPYVVFQDVEQVGTIQADIHGLSNSQKEDLIEAAEVDVRTGFMGITSKLASNLRALLAAIRALLGRGEVGQPG